MKRILLIIAIAGITFGCEIDEQINPNAPALDNIIANASKTELNNLVTGILARMRNGHSIYVTASGTIARESYLFDADPRNTTELVGTDGALDNDTFYSTANWISRYRTIKNCNILLESLAGAEPGVSEAEKEGYRGFAKTMMAHQFLVLWSAYFDSGVRLDVADPDNFGPIITDTDQVLTFIRDLFDEANAHFAGAEFGFALTSGFEGFDTPATFSQFNRALAARAALYDEDYADALTHLSNSFFDINGDLGIGPKMIFSTSGGDILNDLYKRPESNANQIVVSDTWIDEAQPGDMRVQEKAALRVNPTTKSGISAAYETRQYSAADSPIDIIRNEELILIYAEANIGTDNTEALAGINRIRTDAGNLAAFGAAYTVTVQDILVERRYSLWNEAHRMVDLRRTGNLNADYITLDDIVVDGESIEQIVFEKFPLIADEVGN